MKKILGFSILAILFLGCAGVLGAILKLGFWAGLLGGLAAVMIVIMVIVALELISA